MAKKTTGGLVLGGGAIALNVWLPWIVALTLGVVLLLAVTVAIVVLTAARGRDRQQQRNSSNVLDRLLALVPTRERPQSTKN